MSRARCQPRVVMRASCTANSNQLAPSVICAWVPPAPKPYLSLTLDSEALAACQALHRAVSWSRSDSPGAQEVVETAMANADRYYRVMTSSRESEEATRAFKAVSLAWLARQQASSNLAAIMASSEVRTCRV